MNGNECMVMQLGIECMDMDAWMAIMVGMYGIATKELNELNECMELKTKVWMIRKECMGIVN